jgi:hypothetical protein
MSVKTTETKKYETLQEFWPFYVQEHRKPATRWMHFVGTSLLFVWLTLALVKRNPKFLLLAFTTPYAWAWVGHFFIEKNRPATFTYPVKSLISDFIMYGKMWRGQMNAEIEKHCK